MSPPSRRRGLKSFDNYILTYRLWSPPSRRRGLKSETCIYRINRYFVASFAEAWIEIPRCVNTIIELKSPPSRRRGLKYRCLDKGIECPVASFAEAWIEIDWSRYTTTDVKSPPSRRRGLKSYLWKSANHLISSPPSRRRGLK